MENGKKIPYRPPKDKMISDAEIKKKEESAVSFLDEIKKE